jgi:soluble lytic murein transglycosylase-like protein/LysM repeat protein
MPARFLLLPIILAFLTLPAAAPALDGGLAFPAPPDEAGSVEDTGDPGEAQADSLDEAVAGAPAGSSDAALADSLSGLAYEAAADPIDALTVDPFLILPPETTVAFDGPLARRAVELAGTPVLQKHMTALLMRGNREWIMRALELSTRYLPGILPILRRYGLPSELSYLCVIESGFSYRTRSRARAVGLWQFIRGTSRLYGMRSDNWVEERYDFERSTGAAARYLRRLYDLLGDWDLALAAYNCGEGKVQRAMREAVKRGREPVFANLRLPRETRHYVPYFYAGLLISMDPARYGLYPRYEKPLEYINARVPGGVTIGQVAEVLSVPVADLAALNPSLLKGRVPHADGGYEVKIPPATLEDKVAALATSLSEVRVLEYTVKKGDNLWTIARRLGVEMNSIVSADGTRPRVIHPGEMLFIPLAAEDPPPRKKG